MKVSRFAGFVATIAAVILVGSTVSKSALAATVCGKNYSSGIATTSPFDRKDGGKGIGLTLNIGVTSGAITSSSIASPGHGYKVGDVGAVDGGNPSAGYRIDSVSDGDPNVLNGTVLGFHLIPLVLDLRNTSPAVGEDPSADAKFFERTAAFNEFGLCQELPRADECGFLDLGESFQTWMFARLASSDPARRQEVIDRLRTLRRSDLGAMGTDTSDKCPGGVSLKGLVDDLKEFFTDAARKGDGDAAMIGLITVLYKYQSVIPSDVQDNILTLIDLAPGPGRVESLSFGASLTTAGTVCALACAEAGVAFPLCVAACGITVAAERVVVPETENHINMIYVSQYLANQFRFQKTGNPQFDNARNGYRALLINRLKDFVRNDFIEYNAHPYQDYDMFALLPLASFATDPAVKAAAKMVLDYLAAKVAVSSNDARRSTPFRRRDEAPDHNCARLIADCADPATAWYMMLTGAIDFLKTDKLAGAPVFLPNGFAPGNYSVAFGWAANNNYRVDPLIVDLFVERKHRNFYQFFHYSRTLATDGFRDSNDELYFGSPSYLITAGGHRTHFAYTADLPFPINLIPGISTGDDKDLGVAVPTYLMPTMDRESRDQMIRFDAGGLCVAPNFACGLNPQTGDYALVVDGNWSFIDQKGAKDTDYGYYVALYRQGNFGFFEVYDTLTNPNSVTNFDDFKTKVKAKNPGPFSAAGPNTYTTLAGKVIVFSPNDAKIATIDGSAPYDPNRTNGTIINNDGQGLVTISNPAKGTMLTLDATASPNHASITVPGPLQFPNTCVGAKSFTTLDVCNGGGDPLFVYNIQSLSNTQFQVTEPSAGYPTTIGPNFCFPFQAVFAPTSTVSSSAKLTISNSDPSVPELKVTANGTGIQQAIATVISNSGNFGNVCAGAYVDLNLTIHNAGGCSLVVSNVASSSPEFIVAGTLSFPLVIQAGDSIAVPIRFTPTGLGAKTANITVTSNDPLTPSKVIAVSGNAPPGKVAVTGSGTFGNVCAGTNAQQAIAVANVGACDLHVSSVQVVGNTAGSLCSEFTIQNNPFPNTLSHDSNLPVTEAFTPTSGGTKSCRLEIKSDDPNAPVVYVPLTATTPAVMLDVPTGGYTFPATVVQSVGACSSKVPFPVNNKGLCPVTINTVAIDGANGADYSLSGLPLLATPLQAGHVLGEGNLNVVFKPTAVPLTRRETGAITVTYEDDPITHHRTSATQNVCGEDASTGVRVLVTEKGAPLALVDKIQLQRLTSNRLGISNDNATKVPLQPAVTQASPCASFQYHREWGGESNPVQLTAGDYQITVNATLPSTGKKVSKTVSFSLDTCTFNQNIVVGF